MLNTIIIVISVSLVLGGAVLTWWFENGPEKKEKPENESDGKAGIGSDGEESGDRKKEDLDMDPASGCGYGGGCLAE